MESIVHKNNLYKLTRFIRRLPNAHIIIKKYSYNLGTEHDQLLADLFDELYKKSLTNVTITKFLDICAAPGIYSGFILDKYPNSNGVGISLDPAEGGCEFRIVSDRYEKICKNIYQVSFEKYNPEYDLCMTSCIPYDISAKYVDEYKIIFKSLTLCLNVLKENGTLVINFSFKNMIFAINFVYLIGLLFKQIKLFKSSRLWIIQRTFYVIGYGYARNETVINQINGYLDDFDNFYQKYYDKLLPEINRKTLSRIMNLFESYVFMTQIMTYMAESVK